MSRLLLHKTHTHYFQLILYMSRVVIGLFKSEELVSHFKLPEFPVQVRRGDNSRLQTDRLLENPGMKMLSKRVKISVSIVNSGFNSLDPGCNAL